MKTFFSVLLIFIISFSLEAQTIKLKSIARFDKIHDVDGYGLRYDEKTGTYIYANYDTLRQKKYNLYSNKGNSGNYDVIEDYGVKFDSYGNYFVSASNNITDTTYTYFLLKNGKEIANYDYLNSSWTEKNGILYYVCSEKNKSYLVSYDILNEKFTKSKGHDEINLCSYPKVQLEGEPIGELGFTTDDKPFYIARDNGKTFLVIGDEEQKHYSDIDMYNVIPDSKGNLVYVAKNGGNFDYFGNAFVVQGVKEYKSYDRIDNIILNKDEVPVYVGSDSADEGSPQRVVIGDKEASKTYGEGIYNAGITDDGKLYFIANEKNKMTEAYESFVVFDGKEGKRYPAINNLKILPGNKIFYITQAADDKSIIIIGNDEIKTGYSSVLDAKILPDGTLAYVGAIYGNYDKKEKDKMYVHIGKEKFGPYESVQTIDYVTGDYFKIDDNKNYMYITNHTNSKDEYITNLITKTGKSPIFDGIQNPVLYKGKALYVASYITDKVNYYSKMRVYFDNKPISPEYDVINDFNFDDKTGVVSFTTLKGKEFFKVEIQL